MDTQEYIQSGVIESYVLGLTTEEETAELLELARIHPAIKKALSETELAFEQHAMANATPPPPQLQLQLLTTLQHEFVATETTAIRSSRPWPYVAAASILLLIISSAFNYHYYNNFKETSDKYQALLLEKNTLQATADVYKASMQLISDPSMSAVKMPGIAGKENNLATVYWNTQTKDVYVTVTRLPQAPAGKQYQLWAIVNGQPVDAGVIDHFEGGICKLKNIPAAQAFAVTLEKAGGVQSPTLSEMYVMGKV